MKKRTNISQLRFKYKKNPLNIKNSDSNPFKQFNKWMNETIRKNVAAVFWWPQIGKQIRIEGYVKIINEKEADYYFSTRTRESQIGAWASNQSSKLKNRKTLVKRFKIIKKRFENKDIPRPSFWSGYEIKPFLIEFWQGRENRLHDRIVYKKINQKKWKKYRLNP